MAIERNLNEQRRDTERDQLPIAAQIDYIARDLNQMAGRYTIGPDNHQRVFELYWRDAQLAAERLNAISQKLAGP